MKAWDFAARAAEFQSGERVDVAFQLEDDPYSASRGYAPWQAILKDARPSSGARQLHAKKLHAVE